MATVEYGKTFNLGNYENERIFLTDDVQPGETADEAYARVRHWVLAKHGEREEVKSRECELLRLQHGIDSAHYRLSEVLSEWRETVRKFDELRALLAKNGLEISPLSTYYLPPEPKPQAEAELAEADEA